MKNLVPSQDIEAEKSLIGSILIDENLLPLIASDLNPDMFYSDSNRIIIKAILSLYKKDKKIDLITLKDQLQKMEVDNEKYGVDKFKTENYLEYVGGLTYLTELLEIVPHTCNYLEYFNIIKEKYNLRLIYKVLNYGVLNIENNLSSEDIINNLQKQIKNIVVGDRKKDILSISDILIEVLNDLSEIDTDIESNKNIKTYLTDLDRILGPLIGGNLVILGARPGMGKTALALNIIRNNILKGKRVVLFSMEMNKKEIVNRFIAMETEINSFKLKNWRNRPEGIDKKDFIEAREKQLLHIMNKVDLYMDSQLYIDTSTNLTPSKLRSKLGLISMSGEIDLVVVDYIGLMKSDTKGLNKTNELGEISRELKIQANEFDCPILALTQLNRESTKRANNEPMLSDIRASGDIEQDANIVMFLHSEQYYDELDLDDTLKVIIAKNRDGKRGKISLEFNKEKQLITDVSQEKLKKLNL